VREQDFKDLTKSVRQAGRIRRGSMKLSRVFTFKPAEIRSIRLKLGKSQAGFAFLFLFLGTGYSTPERTERAYFTKSGME